MESATERQMEIIGEALRNLRRVDEDLAGRIPHAHKIIGMRNVLVHGYAQVDSSIVWAAAKLDVSELIPVLEALLGQFDKEL
ncbi:HepT-like ribonuclease domain-containing protein [Gordonia bronchialis]|uniref:HepT-like ribonuclease domain-containing protein n=2 Tax=Gordonia bronchialis TaxID=2054 RepID=UPI001CBD0551|nr:HepT-like ribonuclease domain-containing protein [Gordonia bronchialis]